MKSRLSAFLRGVAERANGQQVDLHSHGDDSAVTAQSDVLSASLRPSVVEGSATAVDVQAAYPVTEETDVADVADVAHFFLPVQSEEITANAGTLSILSNDGEPQVVESVTCATDATKGHSSEGLEEDAKAINLVANIETSIASRVGEERAVTEFREFREWTHMTAECVFLVDIASGCTKEIPAATPVVIFRSITAARSLGVIKATDFAMQQVMWRAICGGYLLVCVERQVFLANPVYQHKQFQLYRSSSKD